MDISLVLIALGLLIFFSHTFNALFVKTRIPNVLLLMLIGLLVGPIFHFISPQDFGKLGSVFTTITLISILFESGTNLNLNMMKKSLGGAVVLTVVNFLIVVFIGIAVGKYLIGLDWLYSIFLGTALGGTSSAVVIPMLSQLKPGPKAEMLLFLESALSDILCLVVALALMSGIETGELSLLGVFKNMGVAMLCSIVAGLVAGIIWIVVLKKYLGAIKNSMFTTFALAFIIYGFCEHIGWNGGLAILAFGITTGNIGKANFIRRLFAMDEESVLNQQEKNFYSEIVFVLQTYFFVYIGVSIQLNNLWHLIIGAIFVALIFLLRPLTTKFLGKKDLNARDQKLISALGPKGLVAAVLASLPLQSAQHYAQTAGVQADVLSAAVAEKTTEKSIVSVFKSLFSGKNTVADVPNTDALTGSESIDALFASDSVSLNDTLTQVSTMSVDSSAVGNVVNTIGGVDASTFDRAVEMMYSGQSIQNVSYAVVLFSILICSLMVIFIESKYKKQKQMQEAEILVTTEVDSSAEEITGVPENAGNTDNENMADSADHTMPAEDDNNAVDDTDDYVK